MPSVLSPASGQAEAPQGSALALHLPNKAASKASSVAIACDNTPKKKTCDRATMIVPASVTGVARW
jgi:hypothetical protein